MPVKLITLDTTQTLANQLTAISQTEALGFELITFARGIVAGQPSNTATLRRLTPGTKPGPLTMVEVLGTESLLQQDGDVNGGETGGKVLISCAAVLVGGNETNVAAYRG
jgi:hypothetical protein